MLKSPRYFDQLGSTKINYAINPIATDVQVTIGGRLTGNVIIRYRPALLAHPTLAVSAITDMHPTEFETPDDNVVALEPQQNGVIKHTFKMSGVKLSAIQVDDSGNSTDPIWVHITEWV